MKRISLYDTRKMNLTSSDGIDLLFIWKRVKISRLRKIFIIKILKLIYIRYFKRRRNVFTLVPFDFKF